MLKSFLKFIIFFVLGIILTSSCNSRKKEQLSVEALKINFKGDAKIEVGGPFVGIEMHHSYPLLQRISFFLSRGQQS